MDRVQASKLEVGDMVNWQGDKEDLGEVIETGYCAVKIKWYNGQTGALHFNDMKDVQKHDPFWKANQRLAGLAKELSKDPELKKALK